MNTTTLFSLISALVVALMLGLAGLTLYSIEKSRWWDTRTRLAQDSHRLHLELEANIFRLFKQHGDALLIGDRDGGAGERELMQRIAQNLADIRTTIAREIQLVGEEEFAELDTLNLIEADVQRVTTALDSFSASGERLDTSVQIERLAALLDREIDITLTRRIDTALAEELSEVEEVVTEAAAFRRTNRAVVLGFVALSIGLMALAALSFNSQIRRPLTALPGKLSALRQGDYEAPMALDGGREFRELGHVLGDMAQGLAQRDVSREERRRELESQVAARTRELHGLVTQLETGNATRKRLMADISHELRTPLSIILGEAEVALRTARALPTETSDTLARIRDAARHTNQIVDDMLTVARHEAGQLRLDKRESDFSVVLRDAVEIFPRTVSLSLPETPLRVVVDRIRLRQSILAVFHNAHRYGGPTITASLALENGIARLVVEDDGPGMSEQDKAQAFERFFRGSNASGQPHEGSGLGLPIVKAIVEAHGGQIALQDGAAGGLRVVIELPAGPKVRLVDPGANGGLSRRTA
ncbi:two-component system OmpR family sensor kinase [Rhodovulum iodosum]|uniref:histidine kinase n=1 Tax=Rhodovulum iodosum TaxID=68291 RepID=A0ABV3XX71_9RHOB|nr:HAMP domain-containing sensor histidine kinase [Rhodovulum robiginosum]RSK37794.1 sensor histidine kinase [Rhodovulum robiginosum]